MLSTRNYQWCGNSLPTTSRLSALTMHQRASPAITNNVARMQTPSAAFHDPSRIDNHIEIFASKRWTGARTAGVVRHREEVAESNLLWMSPRNHGARRRSRYAWSAPRGPQVTIAKRVFESTQRRRGQRERGPGGEKGVGRRDGSRPKHVLTLGAAREDPRRA